MNRVHFKRNKLNARRDGSYIGYAGVGRVYPAKHIYITVSSHNSLFAFVTRHNAQPKNVRTPKPASEINESQAKIHSERDREEEEKRKGAGNRGLVECVVALAKNEDE